MLINNNINARVHEIPVHGYIDGRKLYISTRLIIISHEQKHLCTRIELKCNYFASV